jgi:hypothetical protein
MAAIATVNTARLASRMVADACVICILFPGVWWDLVAHCVACLPQLRQTDTDVSPSQRPLKVGTHHFAALLPACHGQM